MAVLLPCCYLAPVSHYSAYFRAEDVRLEVCDHFVKQTFRNRCWIDSPNGALALTVPVVKTGAKTPMRDIRISDHGNWRHQHWIALESSYRQSPFFEYYADDFAHFYEERDGFLMDFNMRLHGTICEQLGLERKIVLLSEIADKEELHTTARDMRQMAEPRALAEVENSTKPYYQVFAQRNGFIPNLSIFDLLFNMGPEGLIVLRDGNR